ncbi:sigma-70 family RNA polymerase sigma factor [Saccharothrix saharensis]|uniref:sigma-70 family RNA polymerase sigma factor n=1 Tax=Saccharothrix saharensis TaxID=571190 RepID=UPI0036A587D6
MSGNPRAADTTASSQVGPSEQELVASARAGDGEAFRAVVEPYRRELHVHCYRMLGSVHDAEDVVQETLLAAWRGIGGYEERASVRTWLYRIATNRCLNALRAVSRRVPADQPELAFPEPSHHRAEPLRLEPYPDVLLDDVVDHGPGPEARYELRESVSLAFLAALQGLPAQQRAVLVLRDVLLFRAAEVADMLGTTENGVTSALKRARAAVAGDLPGRDRAPLPGSPRERQVVADFTRAFQAGDVAAIVAMLTDDVRLSMPPLPQEYHGPDAVGHFLASVALREDRRHVLVPTRANGQPAYGLYVREPGTSVPHPHGMLVLTLAGDRIAALTRFHDNALLPAFGLDA